MSNEKAKSGYSYTALKSYKPANAKDLSAHVQRVQKDVIPKIKEQGERKETGAHRLRMKGAL